MNIETVPFKAEHMKEIADDIIEKTFTPEEWRNWADYNEQTSNALTAYSNGVILACGGVRIETDTMWVVLNKEAANHRKELLYAAKVFIEILTPDIKVLKCQVCVSFEEGHRFVEHLGFKALGTQTALGFDDFERIAA